MDKFEREKLIEDLDEIRNKLASAQLNDVHSHPNGDRVRILYCSIEDALTQVKALQRILGVD